MNYMKIGNKIINLDQVVSVEFTEGYVVDYDPGEEYEVVDRYNKPTVYIVGEEGTLGYIKQPTTKITPSFSDTLVYTFTGAWALAVRDAVMDVCTMGDNYPRFVTPNKRHHATITELRQRQEVALEHAARIIAEHEKESS